MTRWRQILTALLVAAMLSVAGAGFASASIDAPPPDAPVIDRAGEEESEDPFHVSDETLATSLFIPFCFVGATLVVFIWAIRNRARAQDDDIAMPWWRTREWYTRGGEEDEA